MICRYGVNTVKEVDVSIRRFEQNGTTIKGVILNAVERKAASYYGGYGYYHYEYTPVKIKTEETMMRSLIMRAALF